MANIERRDVGLRKAPSPQAPPQETAETYAPAPKTDTAEQEKIAGYNRVLQSEQFLSLAPFQQIVTVSSWDLTPEQRAPLISSLKGSYKTSREMVKANRELAAFNPQEEIGQSVSFQQRYVTGQYGGTKTSLPETGFIETSEGLKPISWKSYTPEQQAAVRSYLQSESYRRSLNLGLFITAPLAAAAAPIPAAIGASASMGISQASKALSGGGLLTPEEILQSAGEGALFSVVGGGLVKGLGIAGKGVKAAASRVALNTALGAGIGTAGEYLTTGTLTGAGTLQGAAFGAAFGLAGEAITYEGAKIAKYFAGKTQAKIDASYERQMRFNEAVMRGEIKGETELWKPSGMERFQMRLTKTAAPRGGFAPQTNISRIPSGDVPFNMEMLQRVGAAEELFGFGFVPKSSMATENIPAPLQTVSPSKFPLAPVMFSWKEFKADVATAELNAELKQRAIDRGIPESQLAYDYRGEMGFEKAPLKMEYVEGKTVKYGWKAPFQQPPKGRAPVRPLWESLGAAPKTTLGGTPEAIMGGAPASKTILIPKITGKASPKATAGIFPSGFSESAMWSGYSPLIYSGKPYYQIGRTTLEETPLFLSYPKSGLASPQRLGEALAFGSIAALSPRKISATAEIQAQASIQETLMLLQTPEISELIQTPAKPSPAFPRETSFMRYPPGFKLESSGVRGYSRRKKQKVRGRKREYPILTAEEMLSL